jgi:hypothetical protein
MRLKFKIIQPMMSLIRHSKILANLISKTLSKILARDKKLMEANKTAFRLL